jgi:HK97 family phage major capsid protein
MSINDVKWGNLSPERRQSFERALTGATVAAGGGLLQDFVNRTIQQLTVREWGLTNFLDRKPGSGSQAIINRRAPNAALASWVAAATDPTEGTGTYSQATFAYQTLATRGTVARKLIAQGRTYSDVLADEMAAKAEDFMFQLETTGLVGRNAADAVPDGFLTLVNDNALAGTGVDFLVDGNNPAETAGAFGGGGAALTLGMLDRLVDKCKGSSIPSDLALVLSPKMNRVLAALLQADQRFTNQVEIAAGIIVRTYLGIPIIVSTAMPDTVNDAAGPAAPSIADAANMFTAGDNSIIMCINKRYNWIEELTPMTVLPLAKTTSANDSFDMYMDATFVNANTRGAVSLIGLNGT